MARLRVSLSYLTLPTEPGCAGNGGKNALRLYPVTTEEFPAKAGQLPLTPVFEGLLGGFGSGFAAVKL